MAISVNLAGRVKHIPLAQSNGLLPLLETVVNSIHAIEEGGIPLRQGKITVEILRSKQGKFPFSDDEAKRGPEPSIPIVGFKVTDKGIGFNGC